MHAMFSAFETELHTNGRLQSERRTDEENRRQDELDILRNDAFDAEFGFACDLLDTRPATLAGVAALLVYVRDHDEKECGMGFPDNLQAGSFQSLLIANLAEDLLELMRVSGMMDINEVQGAVHEIEMMVSVLLDAVVTMQAPDTNPTVFEGPARKAR